MKLVSKAAKNWRRISLPLKSWSIALVPLISITNFGFVWASDGNEHSQCIPPFWTITQIHLNKYLLDTKTIRTAGKVLSKTESCVEISSFENQGAPNQSSNILICGLPRADYSPGTYLEVKGEYVAASNRLTTAKTIQFSAPSTNSSVPRYFQYLVDIKSPNSDLAKAFSGGKDYSQPNTTAHQNIEQCQ